ncbi:MAG: FHA domain-containing protein [Desulfobacterales bacterium]|nr:FHA domain-containing protein [Desulfobacterales bacterium]
MSSEQKTYVLKILSGPHLGAEIELRESSYIIGQSEECDLILTDLTVAEKHLKINIAKDKLSVTALDAPVFIAGKKLDNGKDIPLALFQAVAIGSTYFAIGIIGHSWPDIQFPATFVLNEEKSTKEELVNKPTDHDQTIPVPDQPDEAPADDDNTSLKPNNRKKNMILLSFLLIFSLLLLFFQQRHTEEPLAVIEPQQNHTDELKDRIIKILAKLDLKDIKLIQDKNNQWLLQGYVAQGNDLKTLHTELSYLPEQIKTQIWVDEELAKICQEVLLNLGNNLKAASIGQGKIIIKGIVDDKKQMDRALAEIKQDVAGITQLENQIISLEEIIVFCFRMNDEHGLKGKIRFDYQHNRLLALGSLNDDELERWRLSYAKILERYPDVEIQEDFKSPILGGAENQPTVHAQLQPKLSISGVSIGPIRYITQTDGSKLFEGSVILNEYVIKSIFSDRIILTKNGENFQYWIAKTN